MIKVSDYDPKLVEEIVQFRKETYIGHGRDPNHAQEWSSDEFDQNATQVVMYDEQEQIIGAVRIIAGPGRWSIEDYYRFEYDKDRGVEFGRLAISRKSLNGKRVLYELIKAACRYCAERDRTHFYGFVIARLRQEIQRLGIPFDELSPPVAPMGENSYLVRFQVDEVVPALMAM